MSVEVKRKSIHFYGKQVPQQMNTAMWLQTPLPLGKKHVKRKKVIYSLEMYSISNQFFDIHITLTNMYFFHFSFFCMNLHSNSLYKRSRF